MHCNPLSLTLVPQVQLLTCTCHNNHKLHFPAERVCLAYLCTLSLENNYKAVNFWPITSICRWLRPTDDRRRTSPNTM